MNTCINPHCTGTGLNKSNEFNSIAGDGLGHNSYGAYTPELSFINNHANGTLSTSNSNSNLNSGGSSSGNHSVIVPVAQRRANSFKEKGTVCFTVCNVHYVDHYCAHAHFPARCC